VDEGELAEAKAYLTGSFPLTVETPDEIATQVLNVLFYELPIDELQNFRRRVDAVRVDDLEWVANRYIEPDRLTIVLVGDGAAVVDQLKRVGFNKVEVVSASDLDLSQPDLKRKASNTAAQARPSFSPRRVVSLLRPGRPRPAFAARRAVPLSPVSFTRPAAPRQEAPARAAAPTVPTSAAALVDQAIAAKGGLEKLKAVKTLKAVAQSTFNSPQGPMTTETTTYIEYPDHFRVEGRMPIGEVVQVYAGSDNVWTKDPNKGLVVPPPEARKDFRDSVQRDVLALLLRAQAGGLKMQLKEPGANPDAPKTVYGVELTAADMAPVTLFVDITTGMVARETYSLPAGGGTAEEVFTDYRVVDGVKIAYRASLRRGGLLVLTRVVTEVKLNVPVEPALFVRPEKVP